ncbi:MAG: glycine--tRNA ligase, partial [Phaeodactylibacter sp.]|nr:glycine--tRNA ligase [Phaeodactylibacter sp.]
LPLKRNEGRLVALAKDIFNDLRLSFQVQYDDTGSIGKLYRRQDAIGTPFCVTVDFESLDDNTVTLRDRDSLEQERVPVAKLEEIISKRVDMKQLLI